MKTGHFSKRPTPPAIAFALLTVLPVNALAPAVITVQGSCLLASAIRAANNNAPNGGCPAGSPGADTIVLTADVTLNAVEECDGDGDNGLPIVTSKITIEGQNHTIERNPFALTDFRIAKVSHIGDLTIDRATVSHGRETKGGAFFNDGILTLRNSTVSFNTSAVMGGAVYGGGDYSALFIEQSALLSNRVTGIGSSYAKGGAVYIFGTASDVLIRDSTFDSNQVGSSPFFSGPALGAAIFGYGFIQIVDSTFSSNSIPNTALARGSAVLIAGSDAAITNTTISGNGSNSSGSAAAVEGYGGTVRLKNVTLSNNGAFQGNDVALRANFTNEIYAESTIIANTFGYGDNCSGPIHNVANNLADDNSCGAIPSGFTDLDPFLADNGGPTKTHAVLAGSNAIDAAGACSVPTDQRGAPRVAECDIGAFEYMGCPVLTLSDDTIVATETHEECSISVGPNFAVVGPGGDLTLRVGSTASFGDGFSVETDGELTVESDPSLQLLLPELIQADRDRRKRVARVR